MKNAEKEQQLDWLISFLINENDEYKDIRMPSDLYGKEQLFRGLVNLRPPLPVSDAFLKLQDEYLKTRLSEHGITKFEELTPISKDIYLWQGDITTIDADAIVNAANSRMLGCFIPCHGCIDNAIHTYAGVQLRLECARIMNEQKTDERTGTAKITKAYNLPSRYVLHTVGPIIHGLVTETDKALLSSCYVSCLELADNYGLKSVAFCCISTGEFHFPNESAARIAIDTVRAWQQKHPDRIKVIFNVFKEKDYEIYRKLL